MRYVAQRCANWLEAVTILPIMHGDDQDANCPRPGTIAVENQIEDVRLA